MRLVCWVTANGVKNWDPNLVADMAFFEVGNRVVFIANTTSILVGGGGVIVTAFV